MYLYILIEITFDGIKSVTSRMDEKGFFLRQSYVEIKAMINDRPTCI